MKHLSKLYITVIAVSSLFISCENEDYSLNKSENQREFTQGNSTKINKIYEYMAAPGQFINEGMEATTMEEAIEFAEKSIVTGKGYVSLGGFGGSLVMGFDHSVRNIYGKDFLIKGNPFVGSYGCSCEPGIVMVMQDENGNGLPDDTWYELKGADHDDESTIKNYSITYHRPDKEDGDIIWEDNQGNKGQITHIEYHSQIYYPKWVEEDSYTLTGTLLKHRTVQDPATGYWSNEPFGDGYADNMAVSKNEDGEYELEFDNEGNKFDISNAVDAKGKHIELEFIDFIKVYTAVNIEAGWLGENSTEVFGAQDINPAYKETVSKN